MKIKKAQILVGGIACIGAAGASAAMTVEIRRHPKPAMKVHEKSARPAAQGTGKPQRDPN